MSKKTHKKSGKPASRSKPSRTTRKTVAKAGKTAAKKTGVSAARKTAQKSAAKSTKRPAAKAAPARTTSRSTRKPAASKAPAIPQSPLTEGDFAPVFTLPRDGGESVSLADYAGRKLVIFFYPRADTPGCTIEAVGFSRLAEAFAANGTAVVGVSADPLKAQDSFRDKHKLTVPLVSDEKLGMLQAYGVWGEKSMYGKTFFGISRTTVLIGSNGRIAKIWRNVKVDGHPEAVLEAAAALSD
ncbi:MAG TPA: peroxiredoxin [Afipia sp.]